MPQSGSAEPGLSGSGSPSRPSGSQHRAPFLSFAGPSISSPIPTLTSLAMPDAGPSSSPNQAFKKERQAPQAGPRIIRTFEEIKVPVKSEEWYEELECPICSQILGATQSLIPCGHSFCGPCCYKWLRSSEQPTCPSCRVEVKDSTSFVPNILIDQIIERKLAGLTDGSEKSAMKIERKEKAQAWKVIQASITPSIPKTKRTRDLEDITTDLVDLARPGLQRNGHSRRASRHLPELGAPVGHHSAHHTEVDALMRAQTMDRNRIRERLADMRMLREERIRYLTEQVSGDRPSAHTGVSTNDAQGNPNGPRNSRTPASRVTTNTNHDPLSFNHPAAYNSPAVTRRRAGGRSDFGSRDDPLVVLSDEETENFRNH